MHKLGFLSYIIIQFVRMNYSVKIYFLPIAGDGGKDELLPHYILSNASSSAFISTLNIRYTAQTGDDYQIDMSIHSGCISIPVNHLEIVLIVGAPQNAEEQLYQLKGLTQQITWVPSGPKF